MILANLITGFFNNSLYKHWKVFVSFAFLHLSLILKEGKTLHEAVES